MTFVRFFFCALLALPLQLAYSINTLWPAKRIPTPVLRSTLRAKRRHFFSPRADSKDDDISDIYWQRELRLPKSLDSPINLKQTSDVVDTALAALGAGLGFWLLDFLEKETGLKFYAPPHAAGAIIMFAGYNPPPAKNVFLGAFGATFLSVAVLELLGDNLEARSLAIAICLIWFKSSGALFPPAAALAAIFFDNENLEALGWSYPFFPCSSGNAVLYSLALTLAPLRKTLRLQANVQQLQRFTATEREKTRAIEERTVECSLDDDPGECVSDSKQLAELVDVDIDEKGGQGPRDPKDARGSSSRQIGPPP